MGLNRHCWLINFYIFVNFFPVCILYNTIFILLQRHYVICFCCTFKQDQTSVFSWTVPFILILPCTVFPWCTNSTVSFWWWNAPLHPSLCMLCWNFYQGRMPVLQPITLLSCNVFPWWRSSLSGLVSSYHEPSLWHHQVAPCILTFGGGSNNPGIAFNWIRGHSAFFIINNSYCGSRTLQRLDMVPAAMPDAHLPLKYQIMRRSCLSTCMWGVWCLKPQPPSSHCPDSPPMISRVLGYLWE